MKTLILLTASMLVLSSCSLFKNRSVQKQTYSIDSTHTYDSTAFSKWKNTTSTDMQTDIRTASLLTNEYDWIIETDTGLVTFDPVNGFTGKAKSIRGKGKTSLQGSTADKSTAKATTSTASENKTKVVEKAQKTIKKTDKAVESKPSSKAITWIAVLTFLFIIIGLAYWKKQRKLASLI